MMSLFASYPLYYDKNYAGKYYYYNSCGIQYRITICDIGWYEISYNYRMVDEHLFEFDSEMGYYATTDSIIFFLSLENEILHQFKIIDTLNFEIIFTKGFSFNEGEFIHRYSAIPPNPNDSCFHYITLWDISYDIKQSSTFKITYNKFSETYKFFSGDVDVYVFDRIMYLPDTIYKYKEGQYRKY